MSITKTLYAKTLTLCILFLLVSISGLWSQKINNIWPVGYHGSINFNENPVVPWQYTKLDTMYPAAYSASICNKYGELLFYTDGLTLWNGEHGYVNPNFKWPWTGKALPLICPYPGNDSLFYIFGTSTGIHKGKLQYLTVKAKDPYEVSIVDPDPAGLYHTDLLSGASFLLAGTGHCNQVDKWIITYSKGSFYSYLVTSSGVKPEPVVSAIPATLLPPAFNTGWSNIKFAANGEKFALPLIDQNKIAVLRFNNLTGVVSAPVLINVPKEKTIQDIELSPDGTKLYMGSFEDTDPGLLQHYLFQMDLDAGSPAQVEASLYLLFDRADREGCTTHGCMYVYRSMQLGPDGKIYVSMREVDPQDQDLSLSVIEDPNKKGSLCSYRKNLTNVGVKYRYLNYNYIRSGSFSLKENGITSKSKGCADDPVEFSLLVSNADSVRWEFGDPSTGASNFSTEMNPRHLFSAPGGYTVTAIISTSCIKDTAKKYVLVQPTKAVRIPISFRDTVLCQGNSLEVDVTTPNATSYEWNNGQTVPVRKLNEPGLYEIVARNECSIDYKRFNMSVEICKCEMHIPDGFSPNNDHHNDVFKPVIQCALKDYQFTIYDRYGRVAFRTSEPQEGWKGKFGASDAPTGLYIWQLTYLNPNNLKPERKHGTVFLVR